MTAQPAPEEYTPVEHEAARIIASLIYPDWPGEPMLGRDPAPCGIYAKPIADLYALYDKVAQVMIQRGEALDARPMAADLWEAFRSNSSAETPYARIDPLLRMFSVSARRLWEAEQRKNGAAPPPTEYTPWQPNIISAAALYRKQFPQLVWLVDGLLPEGLCLLAAKPKSKKSWLALGIAVGVAYGGKAFGYYDVMHGRVLYLDLESNQRRMKTRLRSIIGDRVAWPENFDIVTDWKRGDEGIALLNGYCDAHPDTRLIVIDIWARFRAMRDPKADPYEQDYNALQALNAWAESRNVTVLVIHHTRKAKSDDPFEEISGTNGIVGAVATAMRLAQSPDTPDEQLLHMIGRDIIIDDPIALKWDSYTCQHVYVATGAEASSTAERRAVLATMEDDREYQLKELAALTSKSMTNLSHLLRRLLDDNLVQRTGRGKYEKVVTRDQVDHIDQHDQYGQDDQYDSKDNSTVNLIDTHCDQYGDQIGLTHPDAENQVIDQVDRDSHPGGTLPNGVPRAWVAPPDVQETIDRLHKRIEEQKKEDHHD